MTESERMQQAHAYLLQLANGIDPLTGREAPASDLINRVQISRSLFFAADVLRQVIDAGGVAGGKKRKAKKLPFDLSPEQRAGFTFSNAPTTISQITQRLNDLADPEQMKRLKVSSLTTFLKRSETVCT